MFWAFCRFRVRSSRSHSGIGNVRSQEVSTTAKLSLLLSRRHLSEIHCSPARSQLRAIRCELAFTEGFLSFEQWSTPAFGLLNRGCDVDETPRIARTGLAVPLRASNSTPAIYCRWCHWPVASWRAALLAAQAAAAESWPGL